MAYLTTCQQPVRRRMHHTASKFHHFQDPSTLGPHDLSLHQQTPRIPCDKTPSWQSSILASQTQASRTHEPGVAPRSVTAGGPPCRRRARVPARTGTGRCAPGPAAQRRSSRGSRRPWCRRRGCPGHSRCPRTPDLQSKAGSRPTRTENGH